MVGRLDIEGLTLRLDQALDQPRSHMAPLAGRLDLLCGATVAVLVLDMSGFSRLTEAEGIAAALLEIRRLQRITWGMTQAHGGRVVKACADNLYCVFDTVADAVAAAEAVLTLASAAAGVGFGRILLLDGDLFGAEVNAASRLGEDVAEAGQVLLTPAAQAALSAG